MILLALLASFLAGPHHPASDLYRVQVTTKQDPAPKPDPQAELKRALDQLKSDLTALRSEVEQAGKQQGVTQGALGTLEAKVVELQKRVDTLKPFIDRMAAPGQGVDPIVSVQLEVAAIRGEVSAMKSMSDSFVKWTGFILTILAIFLGIAAFIIFKDRTQMREDIVADGKRTLERTVDDANKALKESRESLDKHNKEIKSEYETLKAEAQKAKVSITDELSRVLAYRLMVSGVTSYYAGDNQSAIKQFEQFLQVYPQAPEALFLMGDVYLSRLKKPSEARHCFERALAIDKDNLESQLGLANCYTLESMYDKALDAINGVERSAGAKLFAAEKNAEVWILKARILKRLNRIPEAKGLAEQVLALMTKVGPPTPLSQYWSMRAREELGEVPQKNSQA